MRTLAALILTAAALAALLTGWFVTGMRELGARRRAILEAPTAEARAEAAALAAELGVKLEQLRASEGARPYYQYQNLYHDPRGAHEGPSVVPSPLAGGGGDPLITGHFQIDAAGRVNVPTINEDVPELSNAERLTEDLVLLAELRMAAEGLAWRDMRPGGDDPHGHAPRVATAAAPTAPRGAAQGAATEGAATEGAAAGAATEYAAAEGAAAATAGATTDAAGPGPAGRVKTEHGPATHVPDTRLPAGRVAAEGATAESDIETPVERESSSPTSSSTSSSPASSSSAARASSASSTERAAADGSPARSSTRSSTPEDASAATHGQAIVPAQVSTFDRSSYVQNAAANDVYLQIVGESSGKAVDRDRKESPATPMSTGSGRTHRLGTDLGGETSSSGSTTAMQRSPQPPRPKVDVGQIGARLGGSVEISTLPFEWRTVALGGVPRLIALRRVETPDGTMTQGFVIASAAAYDWLAGRRAATMPAGLLPGSPVSDREAALPIDGAPWRVTVDSTAALERAALEAAAIPGRFLRGFVPVAVLALAAGGLVVFLVARAERLARLRSQFAAAAAHELRTPLAGIQLHGDMLAGGLGDPARAGEYARRVADEAERLGRVVGNVLGFTQLERGSLIVRPEAGDLSGIVQACCERSRAGLQDAGARIVIDVHEGLRARHDADAVGRILQNLLDNAEKYTRGSDDRTIQVSARAAGSHVEIAVADHGPGLRRGDARRLFQPFRRGHEAGGDRPPGLGLGLALARSLARAQGGDLAVRGTPGGGATFVLTLPAA